MIFEDRGRVGLGSARSFCFSPLFVIILKFIVQTKNLHVRSILFAKRETSMSKKLLCLLVLLFSILSISAQVPPAVDDNNAIFKPVKWRSIGPFRGGRSVASTGVIGDPKTYYMGTTGGGLWKTDDMGISWRNISDGFFKTATIGAIAVAESDSNVIYVGLGEHAPREPAPTSGSCSCYLRSR